MKTGGKFFFKEYLSWLANLCVQKQTLVYTLVLCVSSSLVFANPQGGVVVGGQAIISTSTANTVNIYQGSDKAIINWQSFNISAHEKTQFLQPNSSSIILNRINPNQGASQIFGQLISNGQIILVNQAGIYFGSGAHVNVGSIIASTTGITNQNFLAGKYIFDQSSNYSGSIINEGAIIAAKHGLVALIGNGVSNSGLIEANLGSVVLAAGSKFTMDLSGDQLINFTVDMPTTKAGVDQNGVALKNGVNSSGSVIANGGKILITAKTAEKILDNAINLNGIVEAHSVASHQGVIILSSNQSVNVTGKLNVSGKHGGIIKILGRNIHVGSSAIIKANGQFGGGEILIGGNLHGTGTERNALNTTIDSGALIQANALHNGNGGKIIVWSNDTTSYAGSISAMGGVAGGNGGFVEVSGHQLLNFLGTVNLSAERGQTGTLLLDPENLTIQVAGFTTATQSGSTYTSNVDNSILTVSDLEAALVNANVLVQAGSGGSQAGDITVNNNVSWSNGNSLTLTAFHNVNINAGLTNTAGGSLIVHADNTGTGAGTINFSGSAPQINISNGGVVNFYYNPSSFTTPTDFSTNVSVSGGTVFTPYMLINTASELQNVNSNLNGNYALGKSITLSGSFTPLGSVSANYNGSFDGQDFSISNLGITNTLPNVDIGLFGDISSTATIANVNLTDATLSEKTTNSGSVYVGSLVGLNNGGTILNSSVTNSVITADGTNSGMSGSRGYYDIGGLVGATFGGSISNSSSAGGTITNNIDTDVTASNGIAFTEVGGLVGGEHENVTTGVGAVITNSSSSTAVTSNGNLTVTSGGTGELLIGGLIGRLDQGSSLTNSSSSGAVNVTNIQSVPNGAGYVLIGGLIGVTSVNNTGAITINDVFSTSPVTANLTYTNTSAGAAEFLVGGAFGQSNGIVDNSYSTGTVNVEFSSNATSSQEFLGVGGFAGLTITSIENSYATNRVTVTGTNDGNQIAIGDFVGQQLTLFDREVMDSSSRGTVNVSINNIEGGQLFIGGLAGLFVYFGSPPQTIALTDNYSISALNVSGVNNNSLTAIGGLVGSNGLDAGDPGGNINNSYSAGFINMNIATSNGGRTYGGGLIGENMGSSATLTNNFWDTSNTGFNQNKGVGNMSGTVSGVTPGCFSGGSCVNGGTADLSSMTTYTNAGWNFVTTWGIVNNESYPYLLNSSAGGPPQIISGTSSAGSGAFVDLVTGGTLIDTTITGPNGFFYFFEPNNTIPTNSLGLVYLSGNAIEGNDIFTSSASGASSGLSLTANNIVAGSVNTATIINSDLSTLIGSLNSPNILYMGSGPNITLGTALHPNVDFSTTVNTTYHLNGTLSEIAGGNGNIVFNGPVTLSTNSMINTNNINFANTITGANNLTINATDAVIANTASLANLTIAANTISLNTSSITTTGDQTYNGPVVLDVNSTLTGNNISFSSGISGGTNLTLNGQFVSNSFDLNGALALNNITVNGNAMTNNTLSLDNGSAENWLILGVNRGNVMTTGVVGQFSFSNIQNLTGGNNGNAFIFSDGAAISGLLNGRNLSSENSLNYSAYQTPITVLYSMGTSAGIVENNAAAAITNFININSIIASHGSHIVPSGNGRAGITMTSPASNPNLIKENIAQVITPFTNMYFENNDTSDSSVDFSISPQNSDNNTGEIIIEDTQVVGEDQHVLTNCIITILGGIGACHISWTSGHGRAKTYGYGIIFQ